MNQAPNAAARPAAAATTQSAVAPSPLDVLIEQPMRRYDLALEPQSDASVAEIARRCAKMHLAGCVNEDDAHLRILQGRTLGLPAMASVQSIFPIATDNGVRLGMYAKTKLALALSRPDIIEYVRFTHIAADKVIVIGKRIGQPEAPPSEFTIQDAERAGLVGRGDSRDKQGRNNNNYDKYPKDMLGWKACSRLLDQIAGDILHGIASVEDLEDSATDKTPRGELPEGVKESVPARDWTKEADALKTECRDAFDAKSNARIKDFRKKFASFSAEAPADVSEEVQRFYNVLAGEITKAKAAPPTDAASQTPAPAAAAPKAATSSPHAAQEPAAAGAATRSPYLPPNKRGDSYDGPMEPEPPFGAT